MNSTELIQAFRIGVDKVSSLSTPSFEVDEILFFLNKAKDRFEENLYLGRNSTGASYDETERNKKALGKLTESWSTDDSDIIEYVYIPNSYQASPLPTDLKYVLRETAVVTYESASDCELASDLQLYITTRLTKITFFRSRMIPVIVVRINDLNNLLQDPYIKPSNDEILRVDIEDNAHILICTDAKNSSGNPLHTPTAYFMQYLRSSNPITLVATYELPDWTHQKIVDIAVSLALENIESVRTQTSILDQIKND